MSPNPSASPNATFALDVPAGRIDAALGALDDIAAKALERTGVPGLALAVVHQDEVVYAKGFGVRDLRTGVPVDQHTVFQLASVSKPLGATVVAGVVGDGTVHWDDPIVKYLPDFALADPYVTRQVTIADAYSHRTGLPPHAGDLLEDMGYGRAEVLRRLAAFPLEPFRAVYHYTNFMLTAGAEAVAAAAGKPWEDLCHERLYAPAGMTSTSSRHADYAAAENRASLHIRVGDTWQPSAGRQPDAQSPAGGASSNVVDMARWLRLQLDNGMLEGQRIVDEAALLEMRVPRMMSNPPDSPASRAGFYGLGLNVSYDATGRVRLSHSGGFNSGAGTVVVLAPSEQLGIVALSNGMAIGLPEAVAASFLDLALTGAQSRDWVDGYGHSFVPLYFNPSVLANATPPASPAPAHGADAYTGTYTNACYGPAEVRAADGGLELCLGPGPMAFALEHWDGDTYAFIPPGENSVGIGAVTFTVGPDGQAASMAIEYLDEGGTGTFVRG
jgi:CubicO group peptidase (beta-lactamase class C family)